ncbi:MAG TPA: division/cell wall cluster transcriptional repressor MraZ [Candidatus Binatia bacterium]|jgi:MraZ protein
MFFGRFDHTLDAKGRISVPAQFRDVLLGDPRLVVAPHTVYGQRCLDLYPHSEWQKLLDKFAALPRFNATATKFEMGYLARAHRCELDAAGRILLPPVLRQHAGLKKDAVFLGVLSRFRVMDADGWMKVEGEHDSEAIANPAMYEELGI